MKEHTRRHIFTKVYIARYIYTDGADIGIKYDHTAYLYNEYDVVQHIFELHDRGYRNVDLIRVRKKIVRTKNII